MRPSPAIGAAAGYEPPHAGGPSVAPRPGDETWLLRRVGPGVPARLRHGGTEHSAVPGHLERRLRLRSIRSEPLPQSRHRPVVVSPVLLG